MVDACQVAVIGGGMIGAAIAYQCAARGMRTALIERAHLAAGGSGANFGLVLPSTGRFDLSYSIAWELEGARRMARLPQELDFDIEYRPAHGYCLLQNDDEIAMFTPHRDRFVAAGFGERFITPAELHAAEPNLALVPQVISALQTDEAVVNPLRLVHGFSQAARRCGAEIRDYCRVTGFEHSAQRITQVITDHGSIAAEHVILAAGSWTRQLAHAVGLSLPEYYIQAEAVVTEPLPPLLNGFVYWGNVERIPAEARVATESVSAGWEARGDACFFKSYDFGTVQTRRGNMLLGQLSYITPKMTWPVSPAVMSGSACAAICLLPQLRQARILRSWRAPAPFTPDHLPLLGRLDPFDNLYVASGFQSAITACTWTGEVMADLVAGAPLPDSARIFDPMRFGAVAGA
jgi:glycine/D-amino acid oxidase-like deaminating enzyme